MAALLPLCFAASIKQEGSGCIDDAKGRKRATCGPLAAGLQPPAAAAHGG